MDRLGEIKVPTLVLAGRYDFLSHQSIRKRWRPAYPARGWVLIERAGHNPTRSSLPRLLGRSGASWSLASPSSPGGRACL